MLPKRVSDSRITKLFLWTEFLAGTFVCHKDSEHKGNHRIFPVLILLQAFSQQVKNMRSHVAKLLICWPVFKNLCCILRTVVAGCYDDSVA